MAAAIPFRKDRALNTPLAEALSIALLVALPAGAVVGPFGPTEAAVAVPAAGTAIATGAISLCHA